MFATAVQGSHPSGARSSNWYQGNDSPLHVIMMSKTSVASQVMLQTGHRSMVKSGGYTLNKHGAAGTKTEV